VDSDFQRWLDTFVWTTTNPLELLGMRTMHAIVLVGGKGSRLLPHTRERPKALVMLGRCAILEIILRRLRAFGFSRVTLCVAHLGEQIRAAYGDGSGLGLSIDYTVDDRPLGTAAPLRLVQDWRTPAVVLNGDILSTVDFGHLLRTHELNRGPLTIAYVRRRLTATVGLVQLADGRVSEILEKPTFGLRVSSGIYAVSPSVRDYLPDGPVDMPGLVSLLVANGEPVHGYGFDGAWHDIGTPGRYLEASRAFESDPDLYLSPAPHDGRQWRAPVSGEPVDALAVAEEGLDLTEFGDRGFGDDDLRSEARA
jgi:NDP-sugar pyrophosphorylase family protein